MQGSSIDRTRLKILFTLFIVVSFFLGLFVGFLIFKKNEGNAPIPIRQSGFKYINPLLFYDTPKDADFIEYASLKRKVKDLISSKVNDNKLTKASVYFRDLKVGHWIGVNQNDPYSPASLGKVPSVIAAMKIAESDPAFLKRKVFYDGKINANLVETIRPEKSILPNTTYTVEDLMMYALTYSDNNALLLLTNQIDKEKLNEVYTDIGLPVPSDAPEADFLSAKEYASFFRVLYNATYLTRSDSEKLLSYLSVPEFKEGIRSGFPESVIASTKFGERGVVNINTKQIIKLELHDCGIVYAKEHPYLLCVMTEGLSFDSLKETIREISKLVYEDMLE